MEVRVLAVAILHFMVYFPHNGSQEMPSQTNRHLSANQPSSSPDSPTASLLPSVPRTEENATTTEDPDGHSGSAGGVAGLSGSLPERSQSQTLGTSLYNSPPLGDDVVSNPTANQISASFANIKGTASNCTGVKVSESNASSSSNATCNASASDTTTPGFAPNSQTTPSRATVSGKNSISGPVSTSTSQQESDPTAASQLQPARAAWSPGAFSTPNGRSTLVFAPAPAANTQNAKNELPASASKSAFTTPDARSFPGVGTTALSEDSEAGVTWDSKVSPDPSAGVLMPRKQHRSLKNKEMANAGESTLPVKAESAGEDDADFQIKEEVPPAYYFLGFESDNSGFGRNGFRAADTTQSLSQSRVIPEAAVGDREPGAPREESVSILYDITNAAKDRTHFKPKATKMIVSGLGKSVAGMQNV
uniref:Uncharacterized protein n=1 Tax=Otolemur garnettii TaxID=30611 RepID=H0XR70_OTOGA